MKSTESEEIPKQRSFSPDEGPGDAWYAHEDDSYKILKQHVRLPNEKPGSILHMPQDAPEQTPVQRASAVANARNPQQGATSQPSQLRVSVTFGEAHWRAILDVLEAGCRARGSEWVQWQRYIGQVIEDAIDLEKLYDGPPAKRQETWRDFMDPSDFEPPDYDNQGNPYGHPNYGQDW